MDEKIIRAATGEFGRSGLKFTMQQVAAGLHISKKTVYARFASKDDLLVAMLDAAYSEIHRRKAEIMASGGSAADRLRAVIAEPPGFGGGVDFSALSELDEKYPKAAAALKRHLETNWELTLNLVREGIAAGELRQVNLPLLQLMITACIESLMGGGLEKTGLTYRQALEQITDIIMNGIKEVPDAENR